MSERDEKFFDVLDRYSGSIEPLQSWDTDDLLDLQQVLDEELAERDRVAMDEYYRMQEYADDAQGEEDDFIQDQEFVCDDPSCPCSYGGTTD